MRSSMSVLPNGRHTSFLRYTCCFYLAFNSPLLLATQVLDNETRTVTESNPPDHYALINGSTLNLTSGTVLNVSTNNSTLNVSDAATGQVMAIGSQVNIANAQLSGTGNFTVALALTASTATVSNSTLTNIGTEGGALTVNTSQAGVRSEAVVIGSKVLGITQGARVSNKSTLDLHNSTVRASDPTGVGLWLIAGNANAYSSTIEGGTHGIAFEPGRNGAMDSTLVLDGSTVIGHNGSAIKVGQGTTATIDVLNGSTLSGKDGHILEVTEAATAAVRVQNSKLKGNITVGGNSSADLDFDQAFLEGDISNEAGSRTGVTLRNQSTLTGKMHGVSTLNINDAHWQMTGDSNVENLDLKSGTVSFGEAGQFYKLSLANLSGSGTFVMSADFSQAQSSFLEISGNASGNHTVVVRSSGADPLVDSKLHVIHAESGDAQFSLGGGTADLGAWSYRLIQDANGKDWHLDASTRTIGPGTRSVMALFNTAPTVWYGELSSLRSRMGELRYSEGRNAGGWVRTYGNKYNIADASGVGYQQTQQGISLGADARLPYGDGQWLVGLLAGHSKSDLDLNFGSSGTVDSYYAGAYTTWLDADSGYYLDAVLKLNRFQNKAKVAFSDGARAKGDYNNLGLGTSLEFGRHIKLDQGFFVEPFTQLSAMVIQARDYDLSNGLQAEGDRTRSFLGKLGTTAGRQFDLGQGRSVQPYVKAAYAHEFAKNNQARVNDNVFDNDLSGSRAELGLGIAASLSRQLQVHADFDYAHGEHIEQPYGVNLGLRYAW